jgi:alpha-galactosidase
LKYDNCHNEGLSPKFRYPAMRDALNRTGRHIYFSMCEWGREKPYLWAKPIANSWRTTVDIKDIYLSFVHNLERQVGLSAYAGPGAWNDPDMLEVGNGGMSNDEYQAHFSLWAALKAPLLIGCSLKNISNATLQILGNEEIIAINQDPLGIQADLLERDVHEIGFKEIWGG